MKMNGKTILEATREWVNGFNAISSSLIERAFGNNIDDWMELTSVYEGQTVNYQGTEITVVEVDGSDIKVSFEGRFDEFSCWDEETNEYVELENTDNLTMCDDLQYIGSESALWGINGFAISNFDCDTITVEFAVDKYNLSEFESNSWLPMWGTLWTFNEGCDEHWARENPELLSKCGFRVFEDQQTGEIYIGIDGAGYDFYSAHWVPLYKERGLQWHDTNSENVA